MSRVSSRRKPLPIAFTYVSTAAAAIASAQYHAAREPLARGRFCFLPFPIGIGRESTSVPASQAGGTGPFNASFSSASVSR